MNIYDEENYSNSSSNFTMRMMAEGDIYNNDDCSITTENTDETNETIFSSFASKKKQKNEKNKNGAVKLKYLVDNKVISFRVYNSGFIPNTYIRDAITGYKYNKKIGTKDENLFFKVVMPGINPKKREPVFLFFDSPESFERFFIMRCPTEIKNKWHERQVKKN